MNDNLVKIFKSFIFSFVDEENLRDEVRKLREENPDLSDYDLCGVLIRKTSVSSSLSGIITGSVPWPLTLLCAFPDFIAVLVCQTRLILKIAIIAGEDPSADERFNEIVGCMGASAGAVAGTVGIKKIIDCGISPFLLKFILKSMMKAYGFRLLPILGAVSGGVINYSATFASGYMARDLYFPEDAELVDDDEDEDYEDEDEDVEEEDVEEEDVDDDEDDDDEDEEFDNDAPSEDGDAGEPESEEPESDDSEEQKDEGKPEGDDSKDDDVAFDNDKDDANKDGNGK